MECSICYGYGGTTDDAGFVVWRCTACNGTGQTDNPVFTDEVEEMDARSKRVIDSIAQQIDKGGETVSYPRDLEDISDLKLEENLAARRLRRLQGLCSRCGAALWKDGDKDNVPGCAYHERVIGVYADGTVMVEVHGTRWN